ncbi:hypothetical protein, partial [Virgibacillus sp. DJP39]|uniref:hypothetical protein n=1 Tax=Virgibacillus sp. DJP39 TaxID=3409790 RepID=UPI003BB50C0F
HEMHSKKGSIEEVITRILKSLNDEIEYVKEETKNFVNDSGDEEEITTVETYNFSNLDSIEDINEYYISGELVRRYPMKAEEFDPETRKAETVIYPNHAVSTFFFFDLRTEILVFFERNKLGFNQFLVGFKGLLEAHIPDIGFEIFLETDNYPIRERIKMIHKVHKIKSTIIPPNANEEALEKLYDEDTELMAKGNIHRRTTLFESNKRHEKGLDIESNVVSSALNLGEAYLHRGYGKLEVEGETKKGLEVHYDSDKDSPFQTKITEKQKNNFKSFIEHAKNGITIFLGKRTIEKVKNKKYNEFPPDNN